MTFTAGDFPLFAALRAAAADDWRAYIRHPFVASLADGSLPEAAFRHYLIQDYLFLGHLARAYGLAAFKGGTVEDIRFAATGLVTLLDQELQLHLDYCASWGLSPADLAAANEDGATIAYSRYVLERGLAGDILDLQVALAPCIVGYAEIGAGLFADPKTALAGNPYRAWIESYAAADYQAVARAHCAQMERLMARLGAPTRMPALTEIFRTASRLEAAFWQMGLEPFVEC